MVLTSFWKFRLTNFHKIDIFQSGILRVAMKMFLCFQGKSLKSAGRYEKTSGKSMTPYDVALLF